MEHRSLSPDFIVSNDDHVGGNKCTREPSPNVASAQLLKRGGSGMPSELQRLRTMHLFAGAGGGILADILLGHQPVCAVEIDEYCQQVLSARQEDGCFPWFPIFADVQKFDGTRWRGLVDCVSGGFPCQAFSTAARGRNNAPNLWPEMRRIVAEVAPRFVFAENVSKNAIDAAADDLEQMGYKTKAIPLSASDLGADHIRERYWLLAYTNDERELLRRIHAKMAELQGMAQSVWASDPTGSGVADGVAYRMDRLKAIGNGQVPAVAAAAWQALVGAAL